MSNTRTAQTAFPPAAGSAVRARTGAPGLDALVEGGFPSGRSVLVCGGPGTGKTTLALQFLAAGIAEGTPGLLVSVDQKPRHVLADAARFGWDLEGAIARRTLAVLDAAPYFTAARDPAKRLEARQLSAELARRVREIGASRLAVDSLASLVPGDAPRDAARDFLRALLFGIEDNLGCTTVLTWSAHGHGEPLARAGQDEAETLATGVIDLRLARAPEGRFERRLFVRKMRGTRTGLAERAYEIRDGRGLVVEHANP